MWSCLSSHSPKFCGFMPLKIHFLNVTLEEVREKEKIDMYVFYLQGIISFMGVFYLDSYYKSNSNIFLKHLQLWRFGGENNVSTGAISKKTNQSLDRITETAINRYCISIVIELPQEVNWLHILYAFLWIFRVLKFVFFFPFQRKDQKEESLTKFSQDTKLVGNDLGWNQELDSKTFPWTPFDVSVR